MQLGNWIRQTTTTTGTGDLTLASVSGFPTFASQFTQGADGVGTIFYYAILDDTTGAPLEAGWGRMSDSTTLVRVRVLASYSGGTYSEANTAISLPSGTKRVICADLAGARPMSIPGLRANETLRYMGSAHMSTGTGNNKAANTADILFVPFEVRCPGFFTGMGVKVATAVASSSVRLGLYRLTAGLEPGGLVDGTSDIATTSTGWASANFAGGTRRIRPGWYYAAIKSFGANATVFAAEATGRIFSQASMLGGDMAGLATAFGRAAQSAQALPDPAPAVTTWTSAGSDYAPAIYLVAAAP